MDAGTSKRPWLLSRKENRASTKENREHFGIFLDFFGPKRKWHGMAPNGAGSFFFQIIQALPTFWAEWIWILRTFIFFHFLDPKFPGPQISKIWPGPGRAWALGRVGPLGWAS